VVGALSLAVELHEKQWTSTADLCAYVRERLKYLVSARPTAVNMADTQLKIEALLVTWAVGGEGKGEVNVMSMTEIQTRSDTVLFGYLRLVVQLYRNVCKQCMLCDKITVALVNQK